MSSREVRVDVKVSVDEDAIQDAIKDEVDSAIVEAGGKEIFEKAGGGQEMPFSAMEIGSMMRNPAGFAGARMLAMGAAPVAIGLMVKPVTEAVLQELSRPGGFLDKRVRIEIEDQIEFWLTRQQQQNTRIGDRQVIVQAFAGFSNQNSNTHDSIYRRIAEDRGDGYRTSGIGLSDKAIGLKETFG